MLERGLIERSRLPTYFDRIEPELHRYPAIDPASFRATLTEILKS